MDFVFKIVQILICILEAYLVIDFFSAFFRLRGTIDRRYTKTGLILVMAFSISAVNSLNSATINVIASFIIYFSFITLFFQGKFLKKFLYYITAMIIMVGSEFLCVIVLSLQTDFVINEIESGHISVTILTFGVKLLALVLFSIAKRIAERTDNRRMSLKITLLYSIMPISLMGIMIAIACLNVDFASLEFLQILLVISCVLTLLGCVVVFGVFDKYSQSVWQLKQQELMITKLEMEEKHYAQIEQVNQEHASFLHDVRHYMKAIGEMAVNNKDEEILKILSELQIKVSDTEFSTLCANRLLNIILNEKKKEAERKNIQITILVEPGITMYQIADADLIVIMGNLLDNAMEAAEKCKEGYIKVYLFSQNYNHFSVIKIVNSYIGTINMKEDKLQTGKADKEKHGYGIQNVNNMAKKYGGYLQYFYVDNEFTSIVILPMDSL